MNEPDRLPTSSAARVAVISLHTSPLDQPGTGDSGGMNVYIRAVAERLAGQGVAVDVFTRRREDGPTAVEFAPGARVVRVDAGPQHALPKQALPRYVPQFLGGVLAHSRAEGVRYDLVHSHYWLSGWAGRNAKEIWRVPLVASFHTLGKVKNYSRGPFEPMEPSQRLASEGRVIAEADRILAPTPAEAAHLVAMYGADPDRIRLVPPGVDHRLFRARPPEEAKARVHLAGTRLVLFVGRLQAHKGPDIAIRAMAEALARDPEGLRDVVLAVVGGPTDAQGEEIARLMNLASALGVGERVVFYPPQPQHLLADFYSAAEAVLVPSRSESFGLVALEAQACGTPVVAAAVGGLRFVVEDGVTGFLVEGHDPGDFGDRLRTLLSDPVAARRMGRRGIDRSLSFSWEATAAESLAIYQELSAPVEVAS